MMSFSQVKTQTIELTSRVNESSFMCDHIAKSIEALEAYSYQLNIKIVRSTACSCT